MNPPLSRPISMKYFSIASLFTLTNAATIAELVRANPNLKEIAKLADKYPEWQTGSGTLIAPTDAALSNSGDLRGKEGFFFTTQLVPFDQTHYVVLHDTDGKSHLVFDNYETSNPIDPEIHVRFGLGEGKLVKGPSNTIKADNGWLYLSEIAIGSPAPPSVTLPFLGCTLFSNMIEEVGLTRFVDRLTGITMFVPNDDAMSRFNWSEYTNEQKKAFIYYHIVPQIVYSGLMNTGELTTLLDKNTIPVKSSAEGADVGSGPATGRFSLADNFLTGGVAHRLAFVLVPPNLPGREAVVNAVNVPPLSEIESTATRPSPTNRGTSTNPGTSNPTSNSEIFNSFSSFLFGATALLF